MNELEVLGLTDDTVVVFSSDHGGFVGTHGFLYHGSPALFDEGVRVPLVMVWPGRWACSVRQEFVSHVDLLPTFVALAGDAPPEPCHGRSLLPLLQGSCDSAWPDEAYAAFNGDGMTGYTTRMIQTAQWKYVFHPFAFDELYDLQSDPHETRNLSRHPSRSGILASLRARLDVRMKAIGDPVQRLDLWKSRRDAVL